MDKKRWLIAGLSVLMAASVGIGITACGGKTPEHTHTYDAWDHNETQHWKYCDEHGDDKSNIDETTRANHDFKDGKCECGATQTPVTPEHKHTYDAWDHNATQHWKYCDEHGNDKSNIDETTKANHTYKDGECECGAKEPTTAGDWMIDENGAVIAWTGTATELTLPKTVGEVEVKKIAADAFKDNENAAKITKLTVGYFADGFNFLEKGALDPLTGCTEVIYNENWEKAGNSPIYNQTAFLAHIKKVTFNEEVVQTPQSGCAGMTALESVEFKGEVKEYRGSLFANTPLTEITFPASLTTCQSSAFTGMKKLETINYATSKLSWYKKTAQMHPFDDVIGSEAPNGVKLIITDPAAKIGEYTFYGFTHLKSIQWHAEGMGQIAFGAFEGSGVTSLTIPAYFTSQTLNSTGSGPSGSGRSFGGMAALETLTFEPDTQLTKIPDNTFIECSALRKVVIPEGVTSLSGWTFRSCTSLREVVLPSTLEKLSYQSFFEDTLDSLTINKTDGVLTFSPNTATNAGLTFSANGKIYVPADLVEDYKADTKWKLLEDKIVAIPEIDPETQVDVNWYIKGTEAPVHTQKVQQGGELAETDAYKPEAKEGYTFYGWYSDEACTQKVDFPVTVLEAKNFYGEYRENIVLDQRNYYLVGNGQGTIKNSNWALGTSAPASCKFTRDPGTNTYHLNNFELMVGDEMKLCFASTWGANDIYNFGAGTFSKFSDVFEKVSGNGNAKVADGKSGKYNITLVTKGANTATTTKNDSQIVSFTFDCIESYTVTTEDMGWYLTGSMNGWNAIAPNVNYKLTETSAGSGIWEGTFTFAANAEMKPIHFTKTTKGTTVSYATKWGWDGGSNHKIDTAGSYKMSYNVKTNTLTHTAATATASLQGGPVCVLQEVALPVQFTAPSGKRY